MAEKYAAKGTLLQYENPSATWNTIPSVRDFDLPLGEAQRIESTGHDSSGDYDEFVPGTIDVPSFQVEIGWNGTNTHHAYLRTAHAARSTIAMKCTTKDTKVHTFSALVLGIAFSNPLKGLFTATVTIQPTGAITTA